MPKKKKMLKCPYNSKKWTWKIIKQIYLHEWKSCNLKIIHFTRDIGIRVI